MLLAVYAGQGKSGKSNNSSSRAQQNLSERRASRQLDAEEDGSGQNGKECQIKQQEVTASDANGMGMQDVEVAHGPSKRSRLLYPHEKRGTIDRKQFLKESVQVFW